MMIKESSLRRDPDLGGELAFLAKGCDFVLPSRFKRRLKAFQQAQVWTLGISLFFSLYFFIGSKNQSVSPLACLFAESYLQLDTSRFKNKPSRLRLQS